MDSQTIAGGPRDVNRDIWPIGDTSYVWHKARFDGYSQARRDAGLEPRGQTIGLSGNLYATGYASMKMILDRRYPITAVYAGYPEVILPMALMKRGTTHLAMRGAPAA